jgi:hypothetical protein
MAKDIIEMNYCFDRLTEYKLRSFYREKSPPICPQNDYIENERLHNHDSGPLCESIFTGTKRR